MSFHAHMHTARTVSSLASFKCHSVLSENPTKPKHVGLSIGHQKSHNFLEIRMADGNNMQVKLYFMV